MTVQGLEAEEEVEDMEERNLGNWPVALQVVEEDPFLPILIFFVLKDPVFK